MVRNGYLVACVLLKTGRYVPEIARLNDYENIINVRGDVNDPGFTLPYGITEVASSTAVLFASWVSG